MKTIYGVWRVFVIEVNSKWDARDMRTCPNIYRSFEWRRNCHKRKWERRWCSSWNHGGFACRQLQTASSQVANVANSQSRTHTDGCKPWKVVAGSKSRYACTPERRDKLSSVLPLCRRRQQYWKNRTLQWQWFFRILFCF